MRSGNCHQEVGKLSLVFLYSWKEYYHTHLVEATRNPVTCLSIVHIRQQQQQHIKYSRVLCALPHDDDVAGVAVRAVLHVHHRVNILDK